MAHTMLLPASQHLHPRAHSIQDTTPPRLMGRTVFEDRFSLAFMYGMTIPSGSGDCGYQAVLNGQPNGQLNGGQRPKPLFAFV
mmetsp:Transcript_40038/g.66699  ORF Transcript_40038/g.66699 Transcript_40038/m.66699 type:complete len:83 (-) Transcript_40038:2630-2878(-)